MLFKDILITANPFIDKDDLHLYRAYCLKNGDEIVFNRDGELLSLSPELAIQNLLNRESIDLKGKVVTIVDTIFSIRENMNNDLGTDYLNDETGSVGVVVDQLAMKEMHISDYMINSIEVDIDKNTERKLLLNIEMQLMD